MFHLNFQWINRLLSQTQIKQKTMILKKTSEFDFFFSRRVSCECDPKIICSLAEQFFKSFLFHSNKCVDSCFEMDVAPVERKKIHLLFKIVRCYFFNFIFSLFNSMESSMKFRLLHGFDNANRLFFFYIVSGWAQSNKILIAFRSRGT